MGRDFNGDDSGTDGERADGYVCAGCGYEPTYRELNNGSCPRCGMHRLPLPDDDPEIGADACGDFTDVED